MKIDELLKMEVFQDDTGITPYCLWCTNSCNKCTSNCVSSCADSCDAGCVSGCVDGCSEANYSSCTSLCAAVSTKCLVACTSNGAVEIENI